MKSYTLKPFEDKNYLSEEEALKLIESIPIPKDDSGDVDTSEVKQDAPATEILTQDDNPAVDLEGRLIDLNPADNGSHKTQDQWIDYFNDRNEIMVSMPDIYLAGKLGNSQLLDSLRKDFQESWITSSTRIKYENNQDARIIHDYGSKLVKQVEHKVVIPEYRPKPLADVLDTKVGLRYLQVLLGTKDNAQQIKDTLQKLSDYPLDKIKVWSAALSDRPIARASGFSYFGGFLVDGLAYSVWLSLDLGYRPGGRGGRSRGVRFGAAGAPQKNKGVK